MNVTVLHTREILQFHLAAARSSQSLMLRRIAPNLCVRSYGQRPFDRVAAGGGAQCSRTKMRTADERLRTLRLPWIGGSRR